MPEVSFPFLTDKSRAYSFEITICDLKPDRMRRTTQSQLGVCRGRYKVEPQVDRPPERGDGLMNSSRTTCGIADIERTGGGDLGPQSAERFEPALRAKSC